MSAAGLQKSWRRLLLLAVSVPVATLRHAHGGCRRGAVTRSVGRADGDRVNAAVAARITIGGESGGQRAGDLNVPGGDSFVGRDGNNPAHRRGIAVIRG